MFFHQDPFQDIGRLCPDCHTKLHVGTETFRDGKYMVEHCKQCGFRTELPYQKHLDKSFNFW